MNQGYMLNDISGALSMSYSRVKAVLKDAGINAKRYRLKNGKLRSVLSIAQFKKFQKHTIYETVSINGTDKLILKRNIRDYPVLVDIDYEVKE